MKCEFCSKEAAIQIPYMKVALCESHFVAHFEKEFKKEVRRQIKFSGSGGKIAVALSGGKDSSVTLYSIATIFAGRRKVEVEAFTVDEGIRGYRDKSLETAKTLCNSLGIKHTVIGYEEIYGTTMDAEVTDLKGKTPCAVCGPMRRQLINLAADRSNADFVALGMNSDDISQSLLMNVSRGDLDRIARMAPHKKEIPGLVRRVVPLRRLPEKEVLLYAMIKGIGFDSGWCPYYAQAQRNLFRNIVDMIEEKYPGSKLAMTRFQDIIQEKLTDGMKSPVNRCRICGEPTTNEICSVCINTEVVS